MIATNDIEQKNRNLKKTLIYSFVYLIIPIYSFIIYMIFTWDGVYPTMYTYNLGDAQFYHAMIESILEYGSPIGYFGYNEKIPTFGGFGAWSPFTIYSYAVPGFFLNYNVDSLLLINIIFICIGFVVFYLLARPSFTQTLIISILYPLLFSINVFGFSFLVEGFFYCSNMIIAGLIISAIKKKQINNLFVYAIYFFIIYLSLCRIYYGAFLVIPFLFSLKNKKTRKSVIEFILSCFIVVILYFLVQNFTSDYFFPGYDLSIVSEFLKGNIGYSIQLFVDRTYNNIIQIFSFYNYESSSFFFYQPFYTLMLIVVVLYMVVIFTKIKDRDYGFIFQSVIGSSIVVLTIMLANLYFYWNIAIIVRHFCSLIVFSLFFLSFFIDKLSFKKGIPVLIVLFMLFWWIPSKSDFTKLKTDVKTYDDYEKASFSEKIDINPNYSRWDNTVAIIFIVTSDDEMQLIPKGASVNLVDTYYILDPNNVLNSKYYLFNEHEEIELSLIMKGYGKVHQMDEVVLYERKN